MLARAKKILDERDQLTEYSSDKATEMLTNFDMVEGCPLIVTSYFCADFEPCMFKWYHRNIAELNQKVSKETAFTCLATLEPDQAYLYHMRVFTPAVASNRSMF